MTLSDLLLMARALENPRGHENAHLKIGEHVLRLSVSILATVEGAQCSFTDFLFGKEKLGGEIIQRIKLRQKKLFGT